VPSGAESRAGAEGEGSDEHGDCSGAIQSRRSVGASYRAMTGKRCPLCHRRIPRDAWVSRDHAPSCVRKTVGTTRVRKSALGRLAATWMHYAWVAGAVETCLRKQVLSYKHHEVVAPLPPPEQEAWLTKAIEEDWSVRELRAEIRRARPSLPLPEGKAREKRRSRRALEPHSEQWAEHCQATTSERSPEAVAEGCERESRRKLLASPPSALCPYRCPSPQRSRPRTRPECEGRPLWKRPRRHAALTGFRPAGRRCQMRHSG